MPQNWKTYKLEDALEALIDYRGKTPKKTTSGIPLVTAKIVKQGRILEPNEFIAAKDYDKWMVRGFPKVGDVVLTTEAPLGEVAQIKDSDIALAQRIVTLRGKNNTLDNGFLKYFLQSNEGQRRLVARESGTTVTGIKQSELRKVEIVCPAFPEQRAIASILSSLDDKIELNLQMNKTLEEMAMTLYKHWFVDFEFPSSGGVCAAGGGQFPSSGGVVEDRGGSFPSSAVPAVRGGRNTTNYMSLPYNPKLKERAKALRKAGNLAEVLFWQQVHKKQFMGLDFDRQKIIGNYIVDFYCANVNVVVEIDGSSHDNKQDYDAARDAYLEGLGLTVIHITDEAVKKDLAQTMEDLKAHPAFNSPPLEGWSKTGVVNSPPPEGWISSKMKDGVVLSRLQQESPQGVVNSPPPEEYPQGEVVNSPPLEEYPQGEVVNNHPAFQAPLQGRGRGSAEVKGYKSSGGKFIDSELGPIPEGWEVKCMLDIVDLLSGGTPKTTVEEYWNGDICWVSAKDIGNGGIYINDTEKKITDLGVSKSSTKVLPEDTVILVARGSVGKYGMIAKEMAMNQSCYGLFTKGEYSQGLVYLMFSKLIEQFQRMAYGSVFDTITTATFKSTNVVVPPNSIVLELKAQIDPLFDQLKQNILENESLTALRDTLLPKLISGEVRVKDVESQVAEVL